MLKLYIPSQEFFNEETQEFITFDETSVSLEHSLLSISKWESKWHKPFLYDSEKTEEEILDYIRCMSLTQNINDKIYEYVLKRYATEINNYINDSMTATTFKDDNRSRSKDIITAEIIYYWMISLQIPFECQKWHINRLLSLIRVCSIKNQPNKNMSKSEIYRNNKALNAARKSKLKTHG